MTSVSGPPSVLPARVPHGMKRVLGLHGLTIFGIAYMVPLTVFSTLGPSPRSPATASPGPTSSR